MYILIIILIIILIVLIDEFSTFNFYKSSQYYKNTKLPFKELKRNVGRYGEYLVYDHLKDFSCDGSKFLFNLVIPKEKDNNTEIDVLMISPKGIFVIESKNFSGWIFGDENQETWMQTIKTNKGEIVKEKFYNPIFQNRMHVKYLKNLIGNKYPIYSIIAFSDKCFFKEINVGNKIPVIHYENLQTEITALYNKTHNTVLTDTDISELYDKLKTYCNPHFTANNAVQKTTVKEKVEIVKDTNILLPTTLSTQKGIPLTETKKPKEHICPKCGGKMVFRNIRKNGQPPKKFYGCSNFPKCKYTEKYYRTKE